MVEIRGVRSVTFAGGCTLITIGPRVVISYMHHLNTSGTRYINDGEKSTIYLSLKYGVFEHVCHNQSRYTNYWLVLMLDIPVVLSD